MSGFLEGVSCPQRGREPVTDLAAVEVSGLEKSYGRLQVLAGIDLRVAPGSVYSLLGPNGAGKTTIVRILATLLRADAGLARVGGFDVLRDRRQVRRIISLTGQFVSIDGFLTGEENLRMIAQLFGFTRAGARRRASELLQRFDLTDASDRRVATYSGGMRRRLDLAAGLVGRPRIVFLDEPTTGLDIRSRQAMWDVITDLVRDGATVFLTTQYLEEADRLSDRIAVLDRGVIVAEGTAAELKRQVGGGRVDLTASDRAAFERVTRALGRRAVLTDPSSLTVGVATDGSAREVRGLLDEVDPDRADVRDISVHGVTLDDVFLALTGKTTDVETKEPADV
jgi:ABC-2 type transport system ATP-binding protein